MRSTFARHDRGSALLVSMILMIVLAIIGVAVVNRTTREMDAVASKRHWDRALSCAEGARQMLIAQFKTYGMNVVDLQMNQVVGDQRYAAGHYDTFTMNSVELAGGSNGGMSRLSGTNRIVGGRGNGLGGRAYRTNVVCSDSASPTHQLEVEFLINFGF